MHLTPVILENIYELLRSTPPFKRWGLPEADAVEFHVHRHRDNRFGDYACIGGRHVIRLSDKRHENMTQVLQTMAHEMTHLHQSLTDRHCRPSNSHGRKFFRLIEQVGRRWGWQPELI